MSKYYNFKVQLFVPKPFPKPWLTLLVVSQYVFPFFHNGIYIFYGHIVTRQNTTFPTSLVPRFSPSGQVLTNEIYVISRAFFTLLTFLPLCWPELYLWLTTVSLHEGEIKFYLV